MNASNLQWFPGHMTKTKRQIADDLKRVDLVVELVDARLPLASRNPMLNEMIGQKPRILVMNKADMADEEKNRAFIDAFKAQGIHTLLVNSNSGEGLNQFTQLVNQALAEKLARAKEKGMRYIPRLMIVGIPNVGKSTLINRLAGRKSMKTGDRPGVTRSKQWIKLQNGYELLDTPGVLWPKFGDPEVALLLAFTGAIRDEVTDMEELACLLLKRLRVHYADALCARYQLDELAEDDYDLLEQIGRKRGCLQSGNRVNTERAAAILLDEFRGAKLGRITLENPEVK
ncbi:MAG: ribosome biogenesis GTPase YlqF [Clostridia bacterium]|nr:ribosome biogenesis GTPase YlqF [Clostridia bacterium]